MCGRSIHHPHPLDRHPEDEDNPMLKTASERPAAAAQAALHEETRRAFARKDGEDVTEQLRSIAKELDRLERERREREESGNDALETPRERELRNAVAVAALQSIMDQLKA